MTDQPITDAELDEWERIEKAATQAWTFIGKNRPTRLIGSCGGPKGQSAQQMNDNYDFAVTARNAFPRLLAENRKLRAHIIDTVGEEGLEALLRDD